MAEVSKTVLGSRYKVKTITEFRKSFETEDTKPLTSQAIDYAIEKDLIDYIDVGPRVRIVVMTDKTKSYQPNKNPKRFTSKLQTSK